MTCPTEPKGRDLGGRPRRIESRGEEHGCDDHGGDADRIRGNDRDITSLDPLELRRRAALVLQTPVLFERTVRDNLLRQPSTARPDLSEARLVHALTDVGLDADLLDRDSATLSGGEKQRVTISLALLGDPEALLLDEPTAALDPPNTAVVVDTISGLRQSRGLTIVAVTHQPELIHRLGGCLLYLVKGRPGGIRVHWVCGRCRSPTSGTIDLPDHAAARTGSPTSGATSWSRSAWRVRDGTVVANGSRHDEQV